MKRKQPYERANLRPADVLLAFDVLVVLGLKDEAIELLRAAALSEASLLRMIRQGADEADKRNIVQAQHG